MKRIYFARLLSVLVGAVLSLSAAANQVAVESRISIQVADRDKTSAEVVAKAELLGGYFNAVDERSVALKVPAVKARELIEFIKSNWKPTEETYRAEEVVTSLDQLRASLKAKEELYAQYANLLANASVADIVEVEIAATHVIGEIEVLKGQLRALQHRLDFSSVVLNFQLLERERPRDNTMSPFPWLNKLGINALLRGFSQ